MIKLPRIEEDKEIFGLMIARISEKESFIPALIEKDYFLTKVLAAIFEIYGEAFMFKGGTCLSKVYLNYYRLSEDLDFSAILPEDAKRSHRSNIMGRFRARFRELCEMANVTCENLRGRGANNSTQYIFYFEYPSILLPGGKGRIKVEIGLRHNPLRKPVRKEIRHLFQDPFEDRSLLELPPVCVLQYEELVSEKLRALLTRRGIAARDFYDLDYVIRQGFRFTDKRFSTLLKAKLAEDKKSTELLDYLPNLGRNDDELAMMSQNIPLELGAVLRPRDLAGFHLPRVLQRIRTSLQSMLAR